MDRRVFLKGVFSGVTAAGVIVAASPQAAAAFASPLMRGAPVLLDVPSHPVTHAGEHLYNARGQCVAVVQRIDLRTPSVEVTSAYDSNRIFIPGERTFDIYARGVGDVVWDVDRAALSLIGAP